MLRLIKISCNFIRAIQIMGIVFSMVVYLPFKIVYKHQSQMYHKQLLTTSVYLSCVTFSGLKITILKSRKPPSSAHTSPDQPLV